MWRNEDIITKNIYQVLNREGPKSSDELYDTLKEYFPDLKKPSLMNYLRKLKRRKKIKFGIERKWRIEKRNERLKESLLKKKRVEESSGVIREGSILEYFKEICEKYNYRNYFTHREQSEAEEITGSKGISEEELDRRKDFRGEEVITIDGQDAKDLDDGVSIKKEGFGYEVGVHIADVSYYIKENTILDKEASRRGNSVYLGNQVIPMLPKELSNGVCSLNKAEERLTLSVLMRINGRGEVIWHDFYEGVIEVKHRFNYDEVEEILEGRKGMEFRFEKYEASLKEMWELANILYEKRLKEGGLDFNIKEVKIKIGAESIPVEVKKVKRLRSHRIIEELMLMANRLVAESLERTGIEKKGLGIYRVHGKPEKEKLEDFVRFARENGYRIPFKMRAKDCQKVLLGISGRKEEKQLNLVLLRAMKQAIYTTKNEGHFALSFKTYTHFTSPIRRYADLMVHRILKKEVMTKGKAWVLKKRGRVDMRRRFLERAAEHLSNTERVAIEAEREIEKKLMARFMKDKVGEEFKGEVSGVIDFGFFVELEPYGVEGLVKVSSLKGYYIYDEKRQCLHNRSKKIWYRIGKEVEVILAGVDIQKGFIDLMVI